MMKKIVSMTVAIVTITTLAACARQSTPSMMNTTRPQVSHETTMDQRPVTEVSEGYLARIANNHQRYGTDTLRLTLAYDPESRSYSAMKAFEDLACFKEKLKEFSVRSISAETVQSSGIEPTLMVAYDSARALAPEGCRNMPGFDDGLTTAHIGEYRFGCSVDTILARQIYRPTDLYGNAADDPGDGRRAVNTVEFYRRVSEDQANGDLNRIQRSDIQQ